MLRTRANATNIIRISLSRDTHAKRVRIIVYNKHHRHFAYKTEHNKVYKFDDNVIFFYFAEHIMHGELIQTRILTFVLLMHLSSSV